MDVLRVSPTAVVLGLCLLLGISNSQAAPWPRHILKAEKTWQLNLPCGERFDASGLLLSTNGTMLTVNDRGAGIYRIQFHEGTNAADLLRLPECFTTKQLEPLAKDKVDRYDTEGVAADAQGRLYLCEEANRWVLRYDPAKQSVERLAIDWKPVEKYFSPLDRNASWEGIAIGNGKIYVANERGIGRIIVVDLETLKVEDDFAVQPSTAFAFDVHYTDLCWFDGRLYALLRESGCVLQIDPTTKKVTREYSYSDMESGSEVRYHNKFPTGTMEGLAVDATHIWLLTDNNGMGRVKYPKDTRPTLFRCVRPDR
jgi:hypothetical protein